MALHAHCKSFLDMLAAMGGKPLEELPLHEARQASLAMIDLAGPPEPTARVDDRTVPGPEGRIPVRVYRPSLAANLPGLVFFHGGGWVICNLDTHDRQCRALANASGAVIVSVEYRLAPEHKFPAAPEDCYAATGYVAERATEFGIDASRLAVGGDSAGGNLAAAVTLMARDRGGPQLRFQLLIYPQVEFGDDSPSMREFGQHHFLTRETMDWFERQYLNSRSDRANPYAAPMRAGSLQHLPPAMIITAECDPLRDQAEAYARRLQEEGVPVELARYEGMIHPFFSLSGIVEGGRVMTGDAGRALRRALAGEPALQ